MPNKAGAISPERAANSPLLTKKSRKRFSLALHSFHRNAGVADVRQASGSCGPASPFDELRRYESNAASIDGLPGLSRPS
jgi:hypothetical protein